MGFSGVPVQDGLAQYPIRIDVPNLRYRRIAIGNPILIIDKDNTLLHRGEDGFQDRCVHTGLKIARNKRSDKRGMVMDRVENKC